MLNEIQNYWNAFQFRFNEKNEEFMFLITCYSFKGLYNVAILILKAIFQAVADKCEVHGRFKI